MEVEEAAAAAATRRVHLRAARAALRVLCAGSHAECAARFAHFFLVVVGPHAHLCAVHAQASARRRSRCTFVLVLAPPALLARCSRTATT